MCSHALLRTEENFVIQEGVGIIFFYRYLDEAIVDGLGERHVDDCVLDVLLQVDLELEQFELVFGCLGRKRLVAVALEGFVGPLEALQA